MKAFIRHLNPSIAFILGLVANTACSGVPEDMQDYDDMSDMTSGATPSEEDLGEVEQGLINGTKTFARPEVGYMSAAGYGCTATLVHPRYIISASHCLDGYTGPLTGSFTITGTNGTSTTTVGIDRVYSYGTGEIDAEDLAFAHLDSNVSSAVAVPAAIATSGLPANSQVSVFGYGCTTRADYSVGQGTKRYLDYYFANTANLCKGDSGGPRFQGWHTGTGALWGINSGWDGNTGRDINADAVMFGPALLRGVVGFGGSTTTAPTIANFSQIAAESTKAVSGDFNADGRTDIAFVGPAGWTSVPIAFGNGAGGYGVINQPLANFPALARTAKSVVAADFDGDGDTDIAALGVQGWNSIPIAFSNRNGTFEVKNVANPGFASLAATTGAYAVAGDFDGDGDGDLALLGVNGWTSIPVASSKRDGSFSVTNTTVTDFPIWASWSGAKAVVADFDRDGDADIALTGSSAFNSIPVARSNRLGGFSVVSPALADFPGWAKVSGAKFAVGDFDGDGDGDIAVVGGSGWRTIGFAVSTGGGNFQAANLPITSYPTWARQARYFFGGKINTGATADLILAGGAGWASMPAALLVP